MNSCLSIAAQVLSNSVVNSVNKESIAYILLQLWWLLVSWWARSLSTGLVISISKNFTPFFRKAFHQTRWHLLCSSQLNFLLMRYHCLGNIDKTRGSQFDLKRPAIIISREVIFNHNFPMWMRVQTTFLASTCHNLDHTLKESFYLTSISVVAKNKSTVFCCGLSQLCHCNNKYRGW